MEDQFCRTRMLVGPEGIEKLQNAHVAIFGVGGVGGYVCEALVRAGVGSFDLIDRDRVSESNINRQIIAAHSTVGRWKTEVMAERMADINPSVKVREHRKFFLPENAGEFPFSEYDYIVDAVDTVTAKIGLIMEAKNRGIPVISSMGAGNKQDPSAFCVADIYKTSVCPLARVMRKELKARGIRDLKVVYSTEPPMEPLWQDPDSECDPGRRSTPGSFSFVPSAAGLVLAGEVVRDLIKD